MRLSDAEFYALTMRQFAKLYDRHLEARRHTELLHGYTTAAVINCSEYRPKEPIAPSRFMPTLFDKRQAEPPPKRSRKAIADDVRGMMRGLSLASNRKPNG